MPFGNTYYEGDFRILNDSECKKLIDLIPIKKERKIRIASSGL